MFWFWILKREAESKKEEEEKGRYKQLASTSAPTWGQVRMSKSNVGNQQQDGPWGGASQGSGDGCLPGMNGPPVCAFSLLVPSLSFLLTQGCQSDSTKGRVAVGFCFFWGGAQLEALFAYIWVLIFLFFLLHQGQFCYSWSQWQNRTVCNFSRF